MWIKKRQIPIRNIFTSVLRLLELYRKTSVVFWDRGRALYHYVLYYQETKYETESFLNLCLHSDPTQEERTGC